ncbi:serine/threonine-protein kinase [Actinoplanes sp. M2I2]|uniref:protein kinase domain-containing protein n=1 Tax=Actinoplanes sp. M2I2 TaxID=1734444 RepID=UPI0020227E63|nr:serine/threonine-protein kinase [Actinoplanes sp. M2I2]
MTQHGTRDRSSVGSRADTHGTSTMDLSGRCVGSAYMLQRPLGQGATGTVWEALDRATGEAVAVKLLHESLLRQPRLVTRFVQERTILRMLRHRNVVRVHDLFSVGETIGLVMDLVSGGSLRDLLRDRPTVAPGEAARLTAQVAAALAEAHDLGVVHRDVKPDNILLDTTDGRLDTRLTDFGVARILHTPSMTTPNAVVGTPHYMSPEAFHGAAASPATDIYALGVLFYELVSGRPPYLSDSIPDLMRRHLEGNPVRRSGLPDPVWDVVLACMAQKPRLRPTAAELVADLSDVARRFAGTPALPPPADALAEPPRSEPFLRPALASIDFPSPSFAAVDDGWRFSPTGDRSAPAPADRPLIPAAADRSSNSSASHRAALPPATDRASRSSGSPLASDRDRAPLASDPDRSPLASDPDGSSPASGAHRSASGAHRLSLVPSADGSSPGPAAGRSDRGPADADRAAPAGSRAAESIVPPQRHPGKRNAVPSWRWARPGATMSLIAAAMVASAVATIAWNLGRADGESRDLAAPQIIVAPASAAAAPGAAPVARRSATTPATRAADRRLTGNTRPLATSSAPAAAEPAPTAVRPKAAPRPTKRKPTRSPRLEAQPYGPWQCNQSFAIDLRSKSAARVQPCYMLGRDVRYQASVTAPGGGRGHITVALRDADTGRVVGATKSCDGLAFDGDIATRTCGPASTRPARGRSYAVVMSFNYDRDGRTLTSEARSATFTW